MSDIIEINGKAIFEQKPEVIQAYKKVMEENADKKKNNSIFNVTLSKPEGVFKALEDLATKEAGLNDFIIDYDLRKFYDYHLDDNSIKKILEDTFGEEEAPKILAQLKLTDDKEESNVTFDNRSRLTKMADATKNAYNSTTDAIADGLLFAKDKIVQGSKAVKDGVVKAYDSTTDAIADGMLYTKDKFVQGGKAVKDGAEKAGKATAEAGKKAVEATKEAGQKTVEATKEAGKKAAEVTEKAGEAIAEKANDVKNESVTTYNNMNKGMKFSLFGIGLGAIVAGVSKFVPKFLKNQTAIKVISRAGIFGAIAGLASIIAYGIFATKRVNDAQKDAAQIRENLGKANQKKAALTEEKNKAAENAKKAEEEKAAAIKAQNEANTKAQKAEEAKAAAIKDKNEADAKAKKAEEEKAAAIKATNEAEEKAKKAEEEKDAAIKNKAKADENAEKQKYLANVYREAARKMRLYNFITCTDDEYSKKYEAMVERVKLGDLPVIRSAK